MGNIRWRSKDWRGEEFRHYLHSPCRIWDQECDEIIGLKNFMVQTSLRQLEEVVFIRHQTIPGVFANTTFFTFQCL